MRSQVANYSRLSVLIHSVQHFHRQCQVAFWIIDLIQQDKPVKIVNNVNNDFDLFDLFDLFDIIDFIDSIYIFFCWFIQSGCG